MAADCFSLARLDDAAAQEPARQELRMSGDLGKVDLRVVLGLEPLDARDGAWRDGGQVP